MADSSHCGCFLPDGCWGSDGWHYTRYGRERLMAILKQDFSRKRPHLFGPALREEWQRWWEGQVRAGEVDGGLHSSMKTYLGLAVAFEPCPAYRNKMRREVEADRAARMSEELLA